MTAVGVFYSILRPFRGDSAGPRTSRRIRAWVGAGAVRCGPRAALDAVDATPAVREGDACCFRGAGADPVVLEPDDPNRRALHDVDVAVSIKVDGVHRRRALAMDAGGQQRRRQSDNNASHAMALCYAWPCSASFAALVLNRGLRAAIFVVPLNYAETAVELFQTEAPARSKPRPARGPASRRRGPRAMLDCYEPTGQPNGSLFHGLGPRGSLAGKTARVWPREGSWLPAPRDRAAGHHRNLLAVLMLPPPQKLHFGCVERRGDFCASPTPGQPAPHAAWVERQPGDREATEDAHR